MIEERSASLDWRGLPIRQPFPWEREMTVCIAARCLTKLPPVAEHQAIVLCADRREGNVLGNSETALKIRDVGQWKVLTAGTDSYIFALVKKLRREMAIADNVSANNIDATIRRILHDRKQELSDEYIRFHLAMSLDDFQKFGKERLPPEIHRKALQEIEALDLKADLILAGFINGSPELYQTDSNGMSRPREATAIVGDGDYLASLCLRHRKQNEVTLLNETLYNVFEAKSTQRELAALAPRQ